MPTPFKRSVTVLFLFTACSFYTSAIAARASQAAAAPTQAHPAVVHVGLVIRNLAAIDEVKETWQVTGLLIARWSNPSLRYSSSGGEQIYRDLPATIWRPSFEFANEVTPTNFRPVDLYAQPDGTAVLTQAFNATLSTNLDLRRFPFDHQLLPLVVQARSDDLDRTILRRLASSVAFAFRFGFEQIPNFSRG